MAGLTRITTAGGVPFTVSEEHAPRFKDFLDELEASGYPINATQSGGYNYRNIAGTNTLSNHAHGSAIDINWTDNARGTRGNLPSNIRDIASKHGLTWGGDWKNPDPMHFEVGASSPAPVAQRGVTAFAGLAGLGNKVDASAAGSTPMATSLPQSGVAANAFEGDTPDQVAYNRKLAQALLGDNLSSAPVQHWTQALARVAGAGSGALWQDQARKSERAGQAASTEALKSALLSNNPQAAVASGLSTPYGAQTFGPMAGQMIQSQMQQNTPRAKAEQGLLDIKLAEAKDPTAVYRRRAELAQKIGGVEPGTREFKEFVLTGELSKGSGFKINEVGGKLVATDAAGNAKVIYGGETDQASVKNIQGGLTELSAIPERYGGDSGAFGSAVGPFQGDEKGYVLGPVARALGSMWQIGNEQAPSEARRAIKGARDTLSSVLKPLIRRPGEGAWTDADQQRLDLIVGDFSQVNNKDQYIRELENTRQRINANFGLSLSPVTTSSAKPAAASVVRKTINGKTYVKRDGHWFEE